MQKQLVALALAVSSTLAFADSVPEAAYSPQLYAALENGILILTNEPCTAFEYHGLFDSAAYAVVFGEGDKAGCWFKKDAAVNMIFPDTPGIHTWHEKLFSPVVPAK